MNVRHADKKLEKLESDKNYTGGFSRGLVIAYRKRMQFIRAADNETDFYKWKSLHYEKLKGNRSHQRSMRLNDQFRLILEIEEDRMGNTAVIISIEDYH